MNRGKGLFVTFDGPNGVGKSTMLQSVASRLNQSGFHVFQTKEPTSSLLGQFVRDTEELYNGKVYACMIAADRYFHLTNDILPALSDGKIVLSDRYVESSLVLQKMDGVETEFVWAINRQIHIPDLSVILTVQSEILEQRLMGRSRYSRFERNETRLDELRLYYEAAEFLSKQKFNVLMVENSTGMFDKIVDQIIRKIELLFNERQIKHEK